MENCIICLEKICTQSICCKKCKQTFCEECSKRVIENMSNNMRCINGNCDEEITISQIKHLGKKYIDKYEDVCLIYIRNKMSNVEIPLTGNDIIKKIRKERQELMIKNFPKVVDIIINIALKDSLKKIDRHNKKEVLLSENKMTAKRCFTLLCRGTLNIDYECSLCSHTFCKDCELEKNENHKCKDVDIKSKKFIENHVHCPFCIIPIEKIYGCDNITCPICKKNFSYNTGHATVHGNHHNLVIVQRDTLEKRYLNYSKDIIDVFRKIESFKPKNNNINKLFEFLDDKKKLADKYEKYKIKEFKNKIYYKVLDDIEKMHNTKTLNFSNINNLYSIL